MSQVPPPPSNVQFPTLPQPQGAAPQAGPVVQYVAAPPRPSFVRRFFRSLFVMAFVLSVLVNVYLAAILGTRLDQAFEHKTLTAGTEEKTIAVYPLTGVIDERASQRFDDFCREVQSDAKIKAVVLRIDSPGGGVTASDQIWAQVKKLKDSGRKIVVSMGAVAASGGYYVSAPADCVFAEETTITGSIGVIMAWMVLERGMDKLGIDPFVLKSTHAQGWKDELSLFRQPDERQKAHLLAVVDAMQARFESVVKEGRGGKIAPRTVSYTATAPSGGQPVPLTETEPFNGKIYLAAEAKKLGLVDEIGYQADAIKKARDLAKLGSPSVVEYLPRKSVLDRVLGAEGKASLGLDLKTLDDLQTPRMMMLWHP